MNGVLCHHDDMFSVMVWVKALKEVIMPGQTVIQVCRETEFCVFCSELCLKGTVTFSGCFAQLAGEIKK